MSKQTIQIVTLIGSIEFDDSTSWYSSIKIQCGIGLTKESALKNLIQQDSVSQVLNNHGYSDLRDVPLLESDNEDWLENKELRVSYETREFE